MPTPGADQDNARTATKPAKATGRKRDNNRDGEILRATLDVLTETGYDGMTVDMVAARAKAGKATIYRRWATKGDLVLAAIANAVDRGFDLDGLPDTGTLRGDLVATITPRGLEAGHRRLQVLAALASMLSHTPELAEGVHRALVEPSTAVYRWLLQRAVDRQEIASTTDLSTLALIIPSMTSYRVVFAKEAVDRTFLETIIDRVLLPAVGLMPGESEPQ